jgi:TonB family protein
MSAWRFALTFLVALSLCRTAAFAGEQTTATWSDGHTSALSDEDLTRYATASPGAGYPEAAQKAQLSGSGLYELRINKAGVTTAVAILKSSGKPVLDQAARSAFLKWRFKPGVFTRVRVPVSWSVNRVR